VGVSGSVTTGSSGVGVEVDVPEVVVDVSEVVVDVPEVAVDVSEVEVVPDDEDDVDV
jgi:hypothetical protein